MGAVEVAERGVERSVEKHRVHGPDSEEASRDTESAHGQEQDEEKERTYQQAIESVHPALLMRLRQRSGR